MMGVAALMMAAQIRRQARSEAEATAKLVAHVVTLANRAENAALAAKSSMARAIHGEAKLRARADAYFNALAEADRLLTWWLAREGVMASWPPSIESVFGPGYLQPKGARRKAAGH